MVLDLVDGLPDNTVEKKGGTDAIHGVVFSDTAGAGIVRVERTPANGAEGGINIGEVAGARTADIIALLAAADTIRRKKEVECCPL